MTKTFIVHKVDPLHDRLTQISWHYQVAVRSIQNVNKFAGDNLVGMDELLIPFTGDPSAIRPMVTDPAWKERDAKLLRQTCLELLCDSIQVIEKKHAPQRKALAKAQKVPYDPVDTRRASNFEVEARYYLDETNYNYSKALAQYREDLKAEFTMIKT